MRYFMRIIKVLAENQQVGISRLAALTRMNHKRCTTILLWMEGKGYVSTSLKAGRKTVYVTEKGMPHIRALLSMPLPSSNHSVAS